MIKHNVKVYSTPTCSWCVRAKQYLTDHKISFVNINVAEDEKGREEMIEKSGQMGVPVIEIDGAIIIGFDQPEINKKLGI